MALRSTTVKSRRSEGIIKHNPDGTATVIYPDTDESEEMPTELPADQETTPVVKGEYLRFLCCL